jgi:hypothetical protein
MRHTCAVSKDRAGSAPAAASAYFTDSSYVRTFLQLVNKQMGLPLRGLPIPYNRNRTPARARSPSSFDLSNALCHNPASRKLLRGFLWRLAQSANSHARHPQSHPNPRRQRLLGHLERGGLCATGLSALLGASTNKHPLSYMRVPISSSFATPDALKGWYPPPRSS